ncbi:MAG: tripartite tricarboxylate transporter substrate binding protein [Acidovorax sp.]|uniref:Bug family tripartite tricarboxylate transporter substrate binding protein n=1 Tax=Acidovorax sp. TaxID=1872122 RepID=UPI0039E6ADFC
MRKFAALFAAACFLAGAPTVHAQGPQAAASHYPDKPIRVVVAYAAGQGTDIVARYITDLMAKDLGQPFVIDNRPGAGGNLGTEAAARAPADGYTLTMGTNATHVLNQFLYAKMPFDTATDFEPVGLVGTFPMVVAVNGSVPFASVADLLDATRRKTGATDIAMPSTTARLVVELLKAHTGVPLFGVPYKGSGNAMTDVIGGQLPVIVDTPTALRPHIASGKVKAIGVTSVKPSGLVPGVKPVAEQGVQGFEVIAWNALYAPKGTPPAVVAALSASLNKALSRPEVRQKLLDLGFDPAGGTPEQLAEFARAERKKWGPLIQAAGIRAE